LAHHHLSLQKQVFALAVQQESGQQQAQLHVHHAQLVDMEQELMTSALVHVALAHTR